MLTSPRKMMTRKMDPHLSRRPLPLPRESEPEEMGLSFFENRIYHVENKMLI
jgi:hypothetical protein